MLSANRMGDDEKSCSLKEQHFISIQDAGEVTEAGLKLVDVGDQ